MDANERDVRIIIDNKQLYNVTFIKEMHWTRCDIESLILDNQGRLTVTQGIDNFEIGRYLTLNDKYWLYDVLLAWRNEAIPTSFVTSLGSSNNLVNQHRNPLPNGSKIKIVDDNDSLKLSWIVNNAIPKDPFVGILSIMWLCLWWYGGTQLLKNVPLQFSIVSLFIIVWLTLWIYGICLVIVNLFSLIMPTRPEVLELNGGVLKHNSGTFKGRLNRTSDYRKYFNIIYSMKPISWRINDVDAINLETDAESTILTICCRRYHREIGLGLSNKEKKWLYDMLIEWKCGAK